MARASGCLAVLALLWMLLAAAEAAPNAASNAAPSGGSVPPVMYAENSRRLAASGAYGAAMVPQPWPSSLAFALALVAVVALIGTCLFRAAWKRAAEKQKHIADDWLERCAAWQAREQEARIAASNAASAAVMQQRCWPPGAMRLYVEAPLAAVANLLDSLDTPSEAQSAPPTRMPVIRSAVRIWRQTFGDLLDDSPLASRALIMDESATNLRELIDGVIALSAPSATQRGLHLSASVDRKLAETILADHARLGQLCFLLLNRTIQLSTHREIVLVVRTRPMNSRSQRMLVSVMETGARHALAAQQQGPSLAANDLNMNQPLNDGDTSTETSTDADACVPLCRLLAQRMLGELSITNGPNAGVRASFDAPFTVERWGPSSRPATADTRAPLAPIATMPLDASPGAPPEPFEHRYLDALSEEGVDIPAFLDGWRRAMDDDLARLGGLRRQGDPDDLRSVLHRLSGAVGLVGARGLMEALRRASTSPREQGPGAIDALIDRAKSLVKQLEALPAAHRSSQR
jgi:hypothetical protein